MFTIQLFIENKENKGFYKQTIDKFSYNLYNIDMKNSRLTFNSSTNFTLPIGVYQTLQKDAYYYGFIKNEKPNISGFLNRLIPSLADYQEDLRKRLVEYNDGDEEMAKKCARSIHNVYLYPFTFHDDGVVNVPFRIGKDKYDEFMVIHDERLAFYDTDFTNYVRTILSEYASKTLEQREHLYAYRMVGLLQDAMRRERFCKFYMSEYAVTFAPVSIETSPIYGYRYVVGVDREHRPQAIRLAEIQNAYVTNEKVKITEEMCELISDLLDQIYEEEYNECSD